MRLEYGPFTENRRWPRGTFKIARRSTQATARKRKHRVIRGSMRSPRSCKDPKDSLEAFEQAFLFQWLQLYFRADVAKAIWRSARPRQFTRNARNLSPR